MSTNCRSCGKMMGKPEDFSGGNEESQYCANCTNADGSLKSLDEITLNIANQLITSQGIDREAATKAARSILSVQPEWKKQIADHDQRPARRQKILLIGISVVLSIALIASLTYIGVRNKKANVYGWEEELVTDKKLFTDIKPVITKVYLDGATVTRVSFPNNQYNIKINKSGDEMFFYDRTHANSGYKIYWQYGGINGIDLGQVGNDLRFIGWADLTEGEQLFYYLTSSSTNSFDINVGGDVSKIMGEYSEDSSNIIGQKIANVASPDDVAMSDNYLAWIQSNTSDPTQQQVYSYNPETWKKYVIDGNPSSKERIRAGKNTVYWLDDYDPDKFGELVKGYNFENRKIIKTNMFGNAFESTIECEIDKTFINYDSWRVLGDDVVSRNSFSGFTFFENKSGADSNIEAEDFIQLYDFQQDPSKFHINNTSDFATSDNYLAWFSNNNDKPCVSWRERPYIYSNKANVVQLSGFSYVFTDLLTINGDWLFWVASTAKDEKQLNDQIDDSKNELPSKNELYATNLKTGKQINLGVYDFSGIENISVTTNENGLIAWTAWTGDAGYDIFYTKLP